jgi:hypothetical protein
MVKKQQNTNWDLINQIIGWVGISLLLLLLLAFVLGGPFRPILGFVGLEIKEFGGVFINCDDPKNEKEDFCRPNPKRIQEREIPSPEKQKGPVDLPFSLNN